MGYSPQKHIFYIFHECTKKLVVLVGTKLEHVIAQLALEVVGATDPCVGTQLKPRDDLFWFGKPEILLWLIQFMSFQVMMTKLLHNSSIIVIT